MKLHKSLWLLAAVLVQPALAQTPSEPVQSQEQATVVVRQDKSIFRRAPVIDGKIDSGEWDTFYTIDTQDLKATTYVDWTSKGLYLAVKADRPVDAMALIDGNNDGWFHGADNYQIKATRPTESGPALQILRYNSQAAKKAEPTAIPSEKAAEAVMTATTGDGGYIVEMELPQDIVDGMALKTNNKLGFRFAVRSGSDDASWIPAVTLGDVEECSLVANKDAALDPLQVHLEIRDAKVIPGEEIRARLFVMNNGSDPVNASSFVIGGEGKSSQYMNSEMIRLDTLQPKKLIRHDFKSRVPADMPIGCWALGAELKSADGRLGGALASFEVVQPYELSLETSQEPVVAGGGWYRITAKITNNTSKSAYGEATIELPEDWQVSKSLFNRKFNIDREDAFELLKFDVKAPETAKAGQVKVTVEVLIDKKTLTATKDVTVVGP